MASTCASSFRLFFSFVCRAVEPCIVCWVVQLGDLVQILYIAVFELEIEDVGIAAHM